MKLPVTFMRSFSATELFLHWSTDTVSWMHFFFTAKVFWDGFYLLLCADISMHHQFLDSAHSTAGEHDVT